MADPRVIAEKGEEIYARLYKTDYERDHPGQFVAIDITTQKAYLSTTPEGALEAARKASPTGSFHLIRVGSPGVFRVGYTARSSGHWISRH